MTLVKKYIFLLFSFFLICSCSSESEPVPEDTPEREDGKVTLGYMPIQISFDYGTGVSYLSGSVNKDEVSLAPGDHHFALFYKAGEEKPIMASLMGSTENDNKDYAGNFTFTYARLWELGDELPEEIEELQQIKTCIVILNSPYEEKDLQEMDKSDLLGKIYDKYYIEVNGKQYFTMVNSTYLDDDNNIRIEADVKVEKDVTIFDDKLKAQEETLKGNAAVVVYVERLASKFSFEFENPTNDFIFEAQDVNNRRINVFTGFDENGIPEYETTLYTYKVKLTGWEMNAREKSTRLFKKINADGKYFESWFDTDKFRTYWSEDPDYDETQYPNQKRMAYDNTSLNYYRKEGVVELDNFSYNEISATAVESESIKANFNRTIYTLENTYNFNDSFLTTHYGERLDLLAGTHLLITAELLTNTGNGKDFQPNDLYRDRIGNFYKTEKDCFLAMVMAFNKELESQRTMKFKSFNWTTYRGEVWRQTTEVDLSGGGYALFYNGKQLTETEIKSLSDNMTFTEEANVEEGDGRRVIWLEGMTILNTSTLQPPKVIDYVESKPEDEKDINHYRSYGLTHDEIRSLMYEWMGGIDHFMNGKMYYAKPVIHNKPICGVVRNHTYTFSLNSVNTIGTPVDDPNQVIVPEIGFTNDEVEVKVKILGWHELSQNANIVTPQ